MNLNELKLRSFRNYREIAAQFDPGVNLIVGDNAQGKTNLLEAISYLGSGKSFRAQKTSEMVRFREDFGEIDGSVFSQERQQSIRWILFRFRGMNQFRQTPMPLPMSSRSSSFPTMPEVTPPASI